MANLIRTFLVDDHELVRDGIRSLLEDSGEIQVLDEGADGIEALQKLEHQRPELLIADIRMPRMNGIELVAEVRKKYPDLKTLILSMHDSEEYVVQSIRAGADGYLLKGSSKEEFMKAIARVMAGEKYFTGDISTVLINHFSDKPGNSAASQDTSDTVESDPFQLTKRELQVLELILEGLSNKDIGEKLDISKRTAEVHRFNLMKKMEVNNLIELTNKAREHGLAGS